MDLYKKATIGLLCFSLLFCACISLKQPIGKIELYNLKYDPPQKIDNIDPFPLVVRIERFSVASTYDTRNIVYRDRSFKRNTYDYHHWKDNPGDIITNCLKRDLKQSGLIKEVLSSENRASFSHILEGSVDEFFQWDAEENWRAVLFISISLMEKNKKGKNKKALFKSTYSTSKPCKQKKPGAVAEAMSEAMKEVSGKIIEDLYHFLKDRY
jgi:cholesterol transport system auxiliary component